MFDDVIGQEVIVRILKSAIIKRAYEAACLFSGPSGTGKTTLGRIFAKAILCENPSNGNPCGVCESCKLFEKEKHFGYREMDAASVGGKEDMVRLRDEASYHSVSEKKILLIDEAHDTSKAGQDSLLKQLEQCPEHLIYIFCTTNPEKLNETLRNRCTQFQITRVTSELIFERLKKICLLESLNFEEDALKQISFLSQGHVRNALNIMQEISYLGDINLTNLNAVSRNYDEEISSIILNLGTDLKSSLDACNKVSSLISVHEMYGLIISMLSDASKLFYGYEDFLPSRLKYLQRLKDHHGYSLVEFLDYLLKRDKFIDKIGLQSDILLLHYKFCQNSFRPQIPVQPVLEHKESVFTNGAPSTSETGSFLSHAELSKLSVRDRSRVLRQQKRSHKNGESQEEERVPREWPLPKEPRLGESSFDEEELSPDEFSRLLVGGRGGES